jgi:DnaK suppressor protein
VTGELTKEQVAELKGRLDDRRQRLQQEIREELLRSDEAHYIDLAERVHDEAEESVADLLVDFSIAIIDRQIRELKEIEQALKRIAMGSYGTCIDCGEPIGFKRLEAHPEAKRCVSCQGVFERTYAQDGTPKL